MAKDPTKTVQIRKIEPVQLELVSTTALEKIMKTEDGKTRVEIQKLAAGRKIGVLARDTATGHFRILSEADLRKAATAPPGEGTKRSGVVTAPPLSETTRKKAGRKDKFGGFTPTTTTEGRAPIREYEGVRPLHCNRGTFPFSGSCASP